ncbi:hypothetical protein AAZV13_09G015200 [Glycine max]
MSRCVGVITFRMVKPEIYFSYLCTAWEYYACVSTCFNLSIYGITYILPFVAWIECMCNCILNSIIHVMTKVAGRLPLMVAEMECKLRSLMILLVLVGISGFEQTYAFSYTDYSCICCLAIYLFCPQRLEGRKHLKLSILYPLCFSLPLVLSLSGDGEKSDISKDWYGVF